MAYDRQYNEMDVFSQLKPLLGKKIDEEYIKYMAARSPQRKARILRRLQLLSISLQHKRINDRKIYLEPPREQVIGGGDYTIGNVVFPGKMPYPFTLHRAELLRHVLMDGPSGSGKTTLILNIMQQLQADGVPWLALDWKRSFRVLMHDAHGEDVIVLTVSTDVAPLRINMLLPPPGVSTAAWVDNLSDTICSGYSLMDGAQSALKAAFFDAFSQYGKRANLRDALVFVQQQKAYVPQRSRNYGWMESTERALKQLTTGSFGDCLNEREHPMLVGELLRMKVAIELVGLGQAQGAKKKIPEIIAALAGHQMSEHHRKMIRYSLSHMKFIEDQIEEIDRDIAARFRRRAWIGNGRSCRPCRECSNAAPRRSSPRPERT